jgi:hypothetical protein
LIALIVIITLIVFGTIPQILTNAALAQFLNNQRFCTTEYDSEIQATVTTCHVGGTGSGQKGGGGGGHTEGSLCDITGNCITGSQSGGVGFSERGNFGGGFHTETFTCSNPSGGPINVLEDCQTDTSSGGVGLGGGSSAPQSGFSSAPQSGFSSAPQSGFSSAPQSGFSSAPQQGGVIGGNQLR